MLARSPRHLGQSLWASLVILGGIIAVGLLQIPQLNALSQRGKNVLPAALEQKVELERLHLNLLQNVPAFGFDNLLADWVFLRFLQYFGDQEARAVNGYQLSPAYFDIIIDRDPRFREAYLFLSTSVSMYAAMPERSVAMMEKGLKSLSPKVSPKAYYIWRYKGIDELLFLGDAQAAKRSFEKAAEWASTYSDRESQSVAAISRQTAQFLEHNRESQSAQVSAWTMLLQNATDDLTRKIAISQIKQLGGEVVRTPEGNMRILLPREE